MTLYNWQINLVMPDRNKSGLQVQHENLQRLTKYESISD